MALAMNNSPAFLNSRGYGQLELTQQNFNPEYPLDAQNLLVRMTSKIVQYLKIGLCVMQFLVVESQQTSSKKSDFPTLQFITIQSEDLRSMEKQFLWSRTFLKEVKTVGQDSLNPSTQSPELQSRQQILLLPSGSGEMSNMLTSPDVVLKKSLPQFYRFSSLLSFVSSQIDTPNQFSLRRMNLLSWIFMKLA